MESVALLNLGQLMSLAKEDLTQARVLLEEAVRIQQELGTLPIWSLALHNLGNVCRDLGDYASARAAISRGSRHLSPNGCPTDSAGMLLADVAGLAACEGQYEEALRLFGAAELQHRGHEWVDRACGTGQSWSDCSPRPRRSRCRGGATGYRPGSDVDTAGSVWLPFEEP